MLNSSVDTKPRFTVLPAQYANKSGDKLLGQGITTLIAKLADQEDGRLLSASKKKKKKKNKKQKTKIVSV